MSNRSAKQDDPIVRELSDIKDLLILDLFTRGVQPVQIAKMLGVDKGNFSREYPMRTILGKPKRRKKKT